jgi:hypothetical protein
MQDDVEPLPQRNLFLPDIDDLAMNHVFAYMEYYEFDLFWSSLSDSFFITGGIAYVTLSLWDWIFVELEHTSYWYYALSLSVPLIYLFNSFIDIIWAANARYTYRVKRNLKQILQPETASTILNSMLLDESNEEEDVPWWHRLRKHAAHRRTILAALFFGIAASLAVLAAVLRFYVDQNVNVSTDGLDMASNHVYILSAIIAITGKRTRPWLTFSSHGCDNILNDSELFEDMGDLLFLIGSLVDGIMWYFEYGERPVWAFISSVMWFMDACFYLRSDLVTNGRARQTGKDALLV